MWRAINNDPMA
jgi:hypothetical protein